MTPGQTRQGAGFLSGRGVVTKMNPRRSGWNPLILLPLLWAMAFPFAGFPAYVSAANSPIWPLWDHFRQTFLQGDGRVIDRTDHDKTTSEGEAYTLFFSLVSGDRKSFRIVLSWIRNNLAQGDLDRHLPAWLWGRRPDGKWGILDINSASDADCWIAYSLIEAGRIWNRPDYASQGRRLLSLIEKNEVVFLEGYGWALLPGPWGFRLPGGMTRLNPSYLAPEILLRLTSVSHHNRWKEILEAALTHMNAIAPHGFVPDWFAVTRDGLVRPDPVTGPIGSYDAIRAYLWAGLLPSRNPVQKRLLAHMSNMFRDVERRFRAPLYANTVAGWTAGTGPAGFSAALLPGLRAQGKTKAVSELRLLLSLACHKGLYGTPPAYYDQVLALFGTGFLDARFSFDGNGNLTLPVAKGMTPAFHPNFPACQSH